MPTKGYYYQFARLTIRLLAELCFQTYKGQAMREEMIRQVPVIADALTWLELNK